MPPPPGRQEASPEDQRAPPTPPPPPTQARERAGGRPPHPPPPHPPQLGSHRRGPPPPRGQGGRPPLRRDGDAEGGAATGPASANPHRRAGATRTTEQEGGRAPHNPPVTTAHSGMTDGGFRSARAPGGAVHGPPFTPPQPRGRTSAPTARARRKGTRRRHGGGQDGVPQATARKESRKAAARHPPPRPPTSPQAAGAPAPTPRGRGDGPPPPERGAGVRPAPPPQPPAPMGAAKNKRAHACAPGRRTDRTQRSLLSTNRSGMGGHVPHGQHNASDARFVACPGKAEGRNEAERPPALQAPPRPHNRGVRRSPPPLPARAPACERHGPAPRRAAPTGTEQGPHGRTPAPTTRGSRTRTARPVGGQSGEGEHMTPDAPRNGRRHPPRGRPAATPTTPRQVGGNRDRTAPPPSTPDGARDRGRTRGGARTTWNGPTSAQCRDHARCARHTTQGGGEQTPRERERTHTKGTHGDYRKGNWTERAERTDRVEWRTSERGYRTPGRDGPPHATQNTRGGEGETRETRRQVPARTPRTGRKRRAHTDGALHPPRQ